MRGLPDIIAGIIFGIMAIIHLARLICPFDLIIADYYVPIWVNAVGYVIAGLLSAWLLRPKLLTN